MPRTMTPPKEPHLRLRKRLGQHFLRDRHVLECILRTGDIGNSDHIFEIGAGSGILTRELLTRARQVTAVEQDERFVETLHALPNQEKLTLLHGDALDVPLPDPPYKVVANIPYQITSPLLRRLFLDGTPPTSLTLLIQKDVAEKICEGGNRLSILVGLFGTPTIICKVSPHAFRPPPKVDSAVLSIRSFPKPLAEGKILDTIFTLTQTAFHGKRKMLRNTIGSLEKGMELLERGGIDPTRRPATLSLHEWITLALYA